MDSDCLDLEDRKYKIEVPLEASCILEISLAVSSPSTPTERSVTPAGAVCCVAEMVYAGLTD